MQFQLSYKRYGAQAILIEWPAKIKNNAVSKAVAVTLVLSAKSMNIILI